MNEYVFMGAAEYISGAVSLGIIFASFLLVLSLLCRQRGREYGSFIRHSD